MFVKLVFGYLIVRNHDKYTFLKTYQKLILREEGKYLTLDEIINLAVKSRGQLEAAK